jgi:hypothetical protein
VCIVSLPSSIMIYGAQLQNHEWKRGGGVIVWVAVISSFLLTDDEEF